MYSGSTTDAFQKYSIGAQNSIRLAHSYSHSHAFLSGPVAMMTQVSTYQFGFSLAYLAALLGVHL